MSRGSYRGSLYLNHLILLIIPYLVAMMTSKATIQQVLNLPKKNWAIVGLSNNKDRAAFHVSKFLVDRGYTIYPVHPSAESVHGAMGYPSLEALAATGVKIDVVDIFVNSNLAGEVVDQAIKVYAKAVWLHEGVIDEKACERARSAGLLAVMNTCPVVELR